MIVEYIYDIFERGKWERARRSDQIISNMSTLFVKHWQHKDLELLLLLTKTKAGWIVAMDDAYETTIFYFHFEILCEFWKKNL